MNYVFCGNKKYIECYLKNLIKSILYYSQEDNKFFIISNEDFEFPIPYINYEKIIIKNPFMTSYKRYGEAGTHINESVFLKSYIFDRLPKDKYMYIDVDCILTDSIDLIGRLLDDYQIVTTKTIWGYKIVDNKWVERTSHNERWNTGFFGVNLNKLPDNIFNNIVGYLDECNISELNGETTVFNDIMTLNNTDILTLPQEWNWCTGYLDDIWNVVPTQAYRYIEMGQLARLKSIHYSGKNKPWNSECLYCDEWRKFN